MVLADLPSGVTQRFEQFGDRRILCDPTDVGTGHPDLAHPGAVHTLPTDECSAARRAALLAVGIREPHSLVGDAVDIRRALAHQAVAVTTQIGDADVVAPDHQNVGLTVRHESGPFSRPSGCYGHPGSGKRDGDASPANASRERYGLDA